MYISLHLQQTCRCIHKYHHKFFEYTRIASYFSLLVANIGVHSLVHVLFILYYVYFRKTYRK